MTRQSFKRYWRKNATNPALRGKPRRWRRWQVLAWYREDKHRYNEEQRIVSIAAANA